MRNAFPFLMLFFPVVICLARRVRSDYFCQKPYGKWLQRHASTLSLCICKWKTRYYGEIVHVHMELICCDKQLKPQFVHLHCVWRNRQADPARTGIQLAAIYDYVSWLIRLSEIWLRLAAETKPGLSNYPACIEKQTMMDCILPFSLPFCLLIGLYLSWSVIGVISPFSPLTLSNSLS